MLLPDHAALQSQDYQQRRVQPSQKNGKTSSSNQSQRRPPAHATVHCRRCRVSYQVKVVVKIINTNAAEVVTTISANILPHLCNCIRILKPDSAHSVQALSAVGSQSYWWCGSKAGLYRPSAARPITDRVHFSLLSNLYITKVQEEVAAAKQCK